MKFNELSISRAKKPLRVGRGISAGRGKTAGRGTKGQGARKSGGVRPGFEGGQMPLYMRIPKLRGFKSFKKPTVNIYTSQLNELSAGKVDTETLLKAGLIEDSHDKVKLIFKGEVKKKFSVSLQAASKSSVEAIQKAGGTFVAVEQLKRPKISDKATQKSSKKAKK